MKKINKKKKGFTLIELLATVVVLGIVLAITVPTIGNVMKKSKSSAFEISYKGIAKNIGERTFLEGNTITCNDFSENPNARKCYDLYDYSKEDYEMAVIKINTVRDVDITSTDGNSTIRDTDMTSETKTEEELKKQQNTNVLPQNSEIENGLVARQMMQVSGLTSSGLKVTRLFDDNEPIYILFFKGKGKFKNLGLGQEIECPIEGACSDDENMLVVYLHNDGSKTGGKDIVIRSYTDLLNRAKQNMLGQDNNSMLAQANQSQGVLTLIPDESIIDRDNSESTNRVPDEAPGLPANEDTEKIEVGSFEDLLKLIDDDECEIIWNQKNQQSQGVLQFLG